MRAGPGYDVFIARDHVRLGLGRVGAELIPRGEFDRVQWAPASKNHKIDYNIVGSVSYSGPHPSVADILNFLVRSFFFARVHGCSVVAAVTMPILPFPAMRLTSPLCRLCHPAPQSRCIALHRIASQEKPECFEDKTVIKEGTSPHNRDGTSCGELTIPYIDLIWSCARRKTPKTYLESHTSPVELCQVRQ